MPIQPVIELRLSSKIRKGWDDSFNEVVQTIPTVILETDEGPREYEGNYILGLKRLLDDTIKAGELGDKSRAESDREVLWHTVSEAFDKLEGGKIADASNILYEALVSCSPPS